MRDVVFCTETQYYRDGTSLKLTYECNAVPINVQWMFWNLAKGTSFCEELSGGPLVKILPSSAGGASSILTGGTDPTCCSVAKLKVLSQRINTWS